MSRPSHRSWRTRLVRSPGLRQDRPRPGAEHPATAADATIRGRRVAVSQCARRPDRRLRYRLRAAAFQRLVRIDGPWGAGWPPRQVGGPSRPVIKVVPAQTTAMRHLSHTAEPPRSWKSRPGGFMARARGPWAGRMTRANRIPPASRPERTSRRAARARVAAFRRPGRSAAAHPVRSGHAPPWADHSQSRISSRSHPRIPGCTICRKVATKRVQEFTVLLDLGYPRIPGCPCLAAALQSAIRDTKRAHGENARGAVRRELSHAGGQASTAGAARQLNHRRQGEPP